jgi:hypothetical protein
MKNNLIKYHCDVIGCSQTVTVPESAQCEPDGWLFLCAWVIGAGGNGPDKPEHFCPECKPAKLKAIGR